MAYRRQSQFHTSATANIAAIVFAALENPGTRILNPADPTSPTVAEIGAAIASELAHGGELLPVDGDSGGIRPQLREQCQP